MKVSKRWFVIVDGARARFVERDEEGRFRTVSSFEATSLHRFVALVIDEIEVALKEGFFDEFVLVAPPRVLGEARQALPATLANVLTDTLSKDLTKTPDHELHAYLLD
jgi:protein required for attachment to host cells